MEDNWTKNQWMPIVIDWNSWLANGKWYCNVMEANEGYNWWAQEQWTIWKAERKKERKERKERSGPNSCNRIRIHGRVSAIEQIDDVA